jgi:hypothetical protein
VAHVARNRSGMSECMVKTAMLLDYLSHSNGSDNLYRQMFPSRRTTRACTQSYTHTHTHTRSHTHTHTRARARARAPTHARTHAPHANTRARALVPAHAHACKRERVSVHSSLTCMPTRPRARPRANACCTMAGFLHDTVRSSLAAWSLGRRG